jgi:catechol 2,3-dioxygenase-like lactoylglutathione lyase family enzyme
LSEQQSPRSRLLTLAKCWGGSSSDPDDFPNIGRSAAARRQLRDIGAALRARMRRPDHGYSYLHCLGLTPNSREENCVLADTDITTLVAVNDLDEASDFYEMKLYLAKVRQEPGWIQYRTGTSDLIVYKSQEAGSNKATTAAWTVDDVASTVDDLKAAGVGTFQQYDNLPGTTRDGDIHHGGPVKMAWFKDPSGNIFEINGR